MAFVLKYGGHAMTEPRSRRALTGEIRQLAKEGLAPIVVHGGGPFIKDALDREGLEHSFIRGLRVTSKESLPVIERTLTLLSKELAQEITHAVGLTGRDATLLQAKAVDNALGYVGRVESVNDKLIKQILSLDLTPVIACIAANEQGQGVLNVNADEVASAFAGAMELPVLFLSNIPGVLDDPNDPRSLMLELSASDIKARIKDGRIKGGMIPKVEAALNALNKGASYAVISDGRKNGCIRQALERQTGTRIIL